MSGVVYRCPQCGEEMLCTPEFQDLRRERNDWHKLADERSAEIVRLTTELSEAKEERDDCAREALELKAELRKYVPSDGVMHQILDYTLTIREAAEAIDGMLTWKDCAPGLIKVFNNWLARPVVVAARKGPANG